MMRVPVKPELIRWARERSRLDYHSLAMRFPKLSEWEDGEQQPTLKQLESFARAVHVPMGYLFLPEPPNEPMPIPDFRTFSGRSLTQPSPNLLDTIYACQERQSWYQEYARITRQPRCSFVGSATVDTPHRRVADSIRQTLEFSVAARRDCPSWSDALRLFIQLADNAGILAMVSGVVLSNNRRPLDIEEFRGFALADFLAPLIFINGSDTKAAQMFTLAHELAHLWLGSSALSNASAAPVAGFRREEVWCNQVAAELLVPFNVLQNELRTDESVDDAKTRLSRHFKVSTLVILRRLLDAKWLDREGFDQAWRREVARLREVKRQGGGGGDFYRTTISRVSKRFARAGRQRVGRTDSLPRCISYAWCLENSDV